jgi:hypothetical protein
MAQNIRKMFMLCEKQGIVSRIGPAKGDYWEVVKG